MTPQQKAEFDQKLAEHREILPGIWWALYSGSVEKGFSEEQAMDLLKTHILVTAMHNKKGENDE